MLQGLEGYCRDSGNVTVIQDLIVCEQALRSGALWRHVFGIWISTSKKSMRNADWRRRHYPWYGFSVFVYIRADWRKSDSSVDGEPQGIWRWNSNSGDIVASSPFFSRPAVRAPQRACSQARDLTATREAGFAKVGEGYGIGRIAMTEVFCEKERKCGINPLPSPPPPTNNKVRLTTATLIFSLNTSSLFLSLYSLKDRKSRTKWATSREAARRQNHSRPVTHTIQQATNIAAAKEGVGVETVIGRLAIKFWFGEKVNIRETGKKEKEKLK